MRGLLFSICLLSLAGLAASSVMLVLYYEPLLLPSWIPCGITPSACGAYVVPKLFSILGVPASAFTAVIFLWIAVMSGTLALSGYGSSVYSVIISSLSWILFGGEIPFAVMRIYSGNIIPLSVILYAVTFLLIIASVIVIKSEKHRDSQYFEKIIRTFMLLKTDASQRFFCALGISVAVLIGAVVFFALISLDAYRDIVSAKHEETRIQKDIFMKQRAEIFKYPSTPIRSGKESAPVKIAVFTDPFCPSCIAFHEMANRLVKEFGDSIVLYYYNFPLEASCNDAVKRTSKIGSCEASRYIFAAAQSGLLEEFYRVQSTRSLEMRRLFQNETSAEKIYSAYFGKGKDPADFLKAVSSREAGERIAEDIAFAKSLSVKKTPTIFINGRRIEVSANYELLRLIIQSQ